MSCCGGLGASEALALVHSGLVHCGLGASERVGWSLSWNPYIYRGSHHNLAYMMRTMGSELGLGFGLGFGLGLG